MISAQNLRPQSSGNKLIAIFCACVLISCNAFKVVSKDKPEEQPANQETESNNNRPDNDKPEDEKSDSDTKSKTGKGLATVEFFGEEFQVEPHKTEFKVALILPFHLNSTDERDLRTSDIMLEYYQGVKIALSELQDEGLKLKLFVYDDENNTAKLKKILDKSFMKYMDVIVGPISEEHIELVSEFALDHDIAVVSPFTTIENLEKPNQRLYSPTPGYEAKAKRMADYILKHYPNDRIVVYGDDKSYSKKMTDLLKKNFEVAAMKNIDFLTSADKVNWPTSLTKDKNNVICVLSRNSTFVNTTLSGIYQAKRDVVVFGENNWSDFEDNDYNFWDNLNVHLVASDFVNDTMDMVQDFRANFREVNREDPGIYSYLGYDQFKFMGEFLMAFGEYFPSYINDREFRYLSSNFRYEFSGNLNQNMNVFILKFEDFGLKPVE